MVMIPKTTRTGKTCATWLHCPTAVTYGRCPTRHGTVHSTATTGTGPAARRWPARGRSATSGPSKFWHRRTKSEKRKPTNLSITNTNALEVTPPNDSPKDSGSEVYDIGEKYLDKDITGTELDRSMDSEARVGNGTPSTVSDTTIIPDIHLNVLEQLQNEKQDALHIDDGETIALMGQPSPDTTQENAELTPDYHFGGSTKFKSRSRESLGNHSTKSEETRMWVVMWSHVSWHVSWHVTCHTVITLSFLIFLFYITE